MAPAKDPPEEDNSEPTVLANEGDSRPREQSDAASTSKVTSSRAKKIKAKYAKDTVPVPDGIEEDEWNKAFNNANSQLHVKGTTKAVDARISGETRQLALKLIANKRRLAAENSGVHASEATSSQNSHPQASLNDSNGETDSPIPHSLQASHNSRNGESSSSNSNSSQAALNNSNEKVDSSTPHSRVALLNNNSSEIAQNNGDQITSQTTTLQTSPNNLTEAMKSDSPPIDGAQEKDNSTQGPQNNPFDVSQIRGARNLTGFMTFEKLNAPAMAASLAESNTPTASMGPPYTIQTSSKTNKRRIVKQVSPEGTQTSSSKSIADKVKGKFRAGKKPDEHETPVNSKAQQPSTFFGRHDIEKPQPFGFDPTSVTDFDPKHPFKGKDSLPTPRQEFNELNTSFEKMRVEQNVDCDEYIRDVPLEPSARSANDFNPDEKWESGPLKRFASFEPFTRASPRSPTSSRANSPTLKQAGKASKKKNNRGQKKKAAQVKKKAAAKEEKENGKSPQPGGSDEASPGASSNDGGSYCICGGPDDHRQMIACDACNIWFHCSCVGVKEGDIPLMDKYICVTCHVPDLLFTTWKPMCRLEGCRMPCDLERDPPSKYCSDEHKAKFWEDAVARAPDGPGPSRGGALNKGELKALLEKTKGDVKAFHALGKKPTLPTPVEAIDWNKILTDEEKARLCQITADKQVLNLRSQGLKDKEKVVRMAMERLKNAIEARKDLVGVCGWDARLAMNEEEFQVWRNSQSGTSVFDSGVLDESFCEKRRCLRHGAWVKLTLTECRMEDNLVHKQLGKLRNEEHAMKDRANTRAASQL